MSRFTQPLTVTAFGDMLRTWDMPITRRDERRWQVELNDFAFEVGEIGSGEIIEIPFHFITDLASVPRFLWFFIPPFGLHARAATVHDFLYRRPAERGGRPRKVCDQIFLDAMIVSGVSKRRANLMYWAVRLFGRRAYKN